MVIEGNKGPGRLEVDVGGDDLEGDSGGLATRRRGDEGDVAAARGGERDRSLVLCGKFA